MQILNKLKYVGVYESKDITRWGMGGCIPLTSLEKMPKSLKSYKVKYFVYILPTIPLTIFQVVMPLLTWFQILNLHDITLIALEAFK